MCINILLGKNRAGKTTYLLEKIEKCRSSNITVVSNISNYLGINKSDTKRKDAIDNSDTPALFGFYYNGDLDDVTNRWYSQYMSLIVKDARVLILDEPEVSLSVREMGDLCRSILKVQEYWDEIYISGHRSGHLLDLSDMDGVKVLLCRGYDGNSVTIEDISMYNHEQTKEVIKKC